MPKINPISRKELISKLKALGFEGPFRATKHQYMIKEKHKIFIPNPHGGKDIGIKGAHHHSPELLNKVDPKSRTISS